MLDIQVSNSWAFYQVRFLGNSSIKEIELDMFKILQQAI